MPEYMSLQARNVVELGHLESPLGHLVSILARARQITSDSLKGRASLPSSQAALTLLSSVLPELLLINILSRTLPTA